MDEKAPSNSLTLNNFDASTALLRGKGDGRALGTHAPPELRTALKLELSEQCGLTGGAYARADAPLLRFPQRNP